MSEYHEPVEELDDRVRDMHRALVSLREELEATDWYAQRVARCVDPELRRILEHNLKEEMEHAAMLLEWLRRTSPDWDGRLRRFLFTSTPLGVEQPPSATSSIARSEIERSVVDLGVGALKVRAP